MENENQSVEEQEEVTSVTTVMGNEVIGEKPDLETLLASIRSGSLSLEDMKALRVAMKPESEASIKRKEAEDSLNTFLSTRMDSEDSEMYETYADLLKDIRELEAKVKGFSKRSPSKTTVKFQWRDRNDRTDFLVIADGVEISVHPDNDVSWLKYFRENGFTEGQIAAVRKERPFRKAKGVLSMEELLELV